jgi:hypothetical protein
MQALGKWPMTGTVLQLPKLPNAAVNNYSFSRLQRLPLAKKITFSWTARLLSILVVNMYSVLRTGTQYLNLPMGKEHHSESGGQEVFTFIYSFKAESI